MGEAPIVTPWLGGSRLAADKSVQNFVMNTSRSALPGDRQDRRYFQEIVEEHIRLSLEAAREDRAREAKKQEEARKNTPEYQIAMRSAEAAIGSMRTYSGEKPAVSSPDEPGWA